MSSREEKPEVFTGDILGTPEYMAQECRKGYYSPYSDMWAMGILTSTLLLGKKNPLTWRHCTFLNPKQK